MRWATVRCYTTRRTTCTSRRCPSVSRGRFAILTLPSLLRFIVILREPVSRAISSYWFKGGKSVRQGEAMLTAQMEDVKRAERCVHEGGTVIACGADGRGAAFATYDHVSKSVYAPQLRRWFDTFGGPCPFYVTTLERLYTRGNDVASVQLRQLLAWAGVPPSATLAEPEIRAVLAERRGTRGAPFPDSFRYRLGAFFKLYNMQLAALIGRGVLADWDAAYKNGISTRRRRRLGTFNETLL